MSAYLLLHSPLVQNIRSNLLVSGAGNTLVNGTYLARGVTFNGRPIYDLSPSGLILWGGSTWAITLSGVTQYHSSDNVSAPWLATTWITNAGTLPLPIVTQL